MTEPLRRRLSILGGEVDPVTPADVLAYAAEAVDQRRPAVIANHNAHSLFLTPRSAGMRAFYAMADLVQIDSTPMIAWGRLLGLPVSRVMRSTYLDWRDAFWRQAVSRGWRVYYVGGAPGVAERGAEALRRRWPGAAIRTHDGYFDASPGSAANAAVLADIAAFDADIIFVGMGMPRQEAWIVQNRAAVPKGVMFSVGAAFDYEAGEQKAAPRWTGPLGLEWLFRLFADPKRLAYRYLVEPLFLVGPALGDLAAVVARLGALRRNGRAEGSF